MESQTNEEYATEAPKSGFDEGEIEENNLPEKKKTRESHKNSPKASRKMLCCKIATTSSVSTCFRGKQTRRHKCKTVENERKRSGSTASKKTKLEKLRTPKGNGMMMMMIMIMMMMMIKRC